MEAVKKWLFIWVALIGVFYTATALTKDDLPNITPAVNNFDIDEIKKLIDSEVGEKRFLKENIDWKKITKADNSYEWESKVSSGYEFILTKDIVGFTSVVSDTPTTRMSVDLCIKVAKKASNGKLTDDSINKILTKAADNKGALQQVIIRPYSFGARVRAKEDNTLKTFSCITVLQKNPKTEVFDIDKLKQFIDAEASKGFIPKADIAWKESGEKEGRELFSQNNKLSIKITEQRVAFVQVLDSTADLIILTAVCGALIENATRHEIKSPEVADIIIAAAENTNETQEVKSQ